MTAVLGGRTTVRGDLLADAITAIEGDRNRSYGNPSGNFIDTANLWATYLGDRFVGDLEPEDVAVMMVLLKVARLKADTLKRDTWMDIAGYAACGWECAV